jgi:nucleotide-binding universal stress UspA family protein
MIINRDPLPASALPAATHLILVGVDGSEPSMAALRWAVRQAEMSGDRLLAVTAWQVPSRDYWGVTPEPADFGAQAEAVLSQAVQQAVGDLPDIAINTLIERGPPALVLVDEARHADILVVGNRGQGEFAGMLLGSVSGYCVTHASCPVVVVPTPGFGERQRA